MSYRPRRRREDHSVDDWLMTYADMITLLLCFFAVFLSVSTPKTKEFEQMRKDMIHQFSSKDQVIILGASGQDGRGQGVLTAQPQMIDPFDEDLQHSGTDNKRALEQLQADGAADSITLARSDATDKNAGQGDGIDTPGDRLLSIDIPSGAFFASGSADLSEDGKALLSDILYNQIAPQMQEGYIITVEGHTDDVPIKTLQFPSNWELSTARASAVVREFIELGMDPKTLRASGYADSFPKAPNRDEAGTALPDNQAQNRRVVIKLEKLVRQ
ncbi:MAG: OmpA family protein [Alphaproteobacteria bacterium]|nr:OmpA family protein [Alphaproteobacteria bacterium]